MTVKIFILTQKEITENYDETLYVPLFVGAKSKNNTFNYLTDDTGDNISELNKYYSEITGEYWVWKNTDLDIFGFCHYRRWFIKNLNLKKITKKDILNDLNKYDIILPHKMKYTKTLYDIQKKLDKRSPNYDLTYEDYLKVEEILENYFPEYSDSYKKVMNNNILYSNNMFICHRNLADKYLKWLFEVLDRIMIEFDLTKYESRDTRVGGFLSERLLTTFILKHNLKIKEYDLLLSENKSPRSQFILCRFPKIQFIMSEFVYLIRKLK